MEEIGAIQGRVRKPLKYFDRVAHMETHIFEALLLDVSKRADYAIEEWFAANETMFGPRDSLTGEMLAGTEADLKL